MAWSPEIADPRRRLALSYARRADRAKLAMLWALDERLGAIVGAAREPMLGEIRLAWWRDALSALGTGAPGGEPLLGGLAMIVRDGGIEGGQLADLADGWTALLAPLPLDAEALDRFATERGSRLFMLSAMLLGVGDHTGIEDAGAAWALADLASHVSDRETAIRSRALLQDRLSAMPSRWPAPLRPLAMLVAFARHEASAPGMVLIRGIWAGLTGRC